MRKGIVLSGVGGQGVVSAGEILGIAASLYEDNMNAVMTAAYGSEARGTFTKADVILSDTLIGYPNVEEPDIILCLAQVAYDRYVDKFKDDTLIFYDTDEVKPKEGAKGKHLGYPFRSTAVELGSLQSENAVAVGAIIKKTGILKAEGVRKAFADRFAGKEKVIQSNQKGFDKGMEL
ncbi:2-oxoacid:acceptor oxidoreductase family protein [Acidaminococcus sp. DS4831]|jgi:2-oxoglutarate ferredoxin oxidoreductase subunit gamma|uniref:2-oxoacid:acceptor oxidoreductase family protein n=1 Tax=Acidaminococcus sp. DS4831 TaxID=3141399 RepID=UPI0032E4D91F